MKAFHIASMILLTALLAGDAGAVEVGSPIPAFSAKALDLGGTEPKTTDLDSLKAGKPMVYFVIGTQCGTSNAYIDRFLELEKAYADKGVGFVYVYPNRTDTSEAKTTFHKEKKLTGLLVDDQGGAIAKAIGAERTAEAYVVSKEGTVVYHGAVDDNKDAAGVKERFVVAALDEHLAGKPVTKGSAPVSA